MSLNKQIIQNLFFSNINRFIPVIEKGFGETWMLEQDMDMSLSDLLVILILCVVLLIVLWDEQKSSEIISEFP